VILCTSGFVNEVLFSDSGLYRALFILISGINSNEVLLTDNDRQLGR